MDLQALPRRHHAETHITSSHNEEHDAGLSSLHESLNDSISSGASSSSNTTSHSLPPITRRDQVTVLLTAFTAIFTTIGPNLSYGVFQTYYLSPASPLSTSASPAIVALIGTLAAGLTWGLSPLITPLLARRYPAYLLPTLGSITASLAFLLASFAHSVGHLLATQGILYGTGAALLYFPLLSTAPPYFNARRASAMGFILSAAGVGGLAYSLATRALLARVGAPWTLRALALVTLSLSLPAALCARPSRAPPLPPGGQQRALVPVAVLRQPAFALQCAAALMQAAGNFVPMTFAGEFTVALGYEAGFGAVLLAVNNGVNAGSRLVMGWMADRWGRQNVLVASVVGSAAAVLGLWLGAVGEGGGDGDGKAARGLWIAFIVLYGMLAGGYMSLFPVTIAEVFGPGAYAGVNSFLYFVRGVGALFGSPVGGQILGEERSGMSQYRKLVWYDGALLVGCAVCVVGVRGFDAVEKKSWRWKA